MKSKFQKKIEIKLKNIKIPVDEHDCFMAASMNGRKQSSEKAFVKSIQGLMKVFVINQNVHFGCRQFTYNYKYNLLLEKEIIYDIEKD